MVSLKETISRVQQFYRFEGQEISGLIAAIFVTGFIFSFRDWGAEQFNFMVGMKNFVLTTLAAALLFFVRFSSQKIYGLREGYLVMFKPWWTGIGLALILSFVTNGLIPLILIGGVSVAFMSKQRMGEFRYGFSYWNNSIISSWAVFSAILMGIFFGLGLYLSPQNYFFSQGLIMSVILGFCVLLPLPQLEAFSIYYGAPWLYVTVIAVMLLSSVLLLTKTMAGLIICVVGATIYLVIQMMISSEK